MQRKQNFLLNAMAAVAVYCLASGTVTGAPVPVVVLPDSPTTVEKSAAAELAGELGKCLGETPKIVAEAAARPDDTKLFVGATQAAKKARGSGTAVSSKPPYQVDEVFLKSIDGGVVMDGDPARAPLYAVDLYLEKYCGVRWWTSDAATYPKLSAAPSSGIDVQYAPQFKYRETYYLDGFDPLFKVRSKGNFTSLTRYLLHEIKFIPPELGGNHRLYFFKGRHSAYHSFFEILPPKEYFEKHPEWYSLVDGKRQPKQLCLANEEMKAEYIKETLKRLREDSSVDFIQVSQNDWRGYCTCEKCKAMMDEDGGAPSGPYLRFANDVAEAVEKEFPNVRIDTFAYQFTRRAPTKTRPRPNVVVRLCDIECDFARPLANPLPPREAKFVKDLMDWKRVAGGNLFIWDYLANFHNYMMPHPNIGSIAPNIRLFAKNGAVGVFEQGDAICSAGTFATLRHYVTSHLLWDPKDDENRLMDEFLEGYYGKSAAPVLKKFIAVVEAGPRKTKQVVKCGHKGAPFLGGGDKLEAAKLMDAAVAAAAKDGEPFASRVRRERLSVDHMMLLNYDALKSIAAKLGYEWTRPETKVEAVENWIRDVRSFGVKARRETTRADEIDNYFESLRRESKPAAPVSATTVPVGDVRVGFTIEMGEWKPSTNAKTGGGVGSDRALVHASIIPHGQMKSLSVTTNGNVVTAVWKGHSLCGDNFTVTAKMTLRPDGGFEYTSFDYAGNESGQYPNRIVFPEVVVPRTAKTALFRPFFAGDILRPDWSKMKTMQRVYSSGLIFKVFNCMAALEEGGISHFFDQRGDARLHASAFEVTVGSAPNTLVLRNIWLPPVTDETRKAASLPYTGVCAPYRGGWYEAARMHRAWMETQPWFKAAAARDFSKLREIDMWMWSRGNIAVSEPPVHWFMKETGLKVALDWYWWHNVPYDTSYPFFWPPRDGEEAFRAAVKRMKERGAFVQVYTNGMLWDEDDSRWAEGGLESTIVRSNGRIYGTTFNPFTKQSQGHMCGEAPKFHAKMRALEKTLASTGLDGVYIDMISCAAHQPCFNPRHKHALGDAHALIEGYRDYVDAVHSDNPGFLLSSEATSEAYLDRFESFIMLYSSWERNGLGTMPHEEPVPAITVIYRGAGVIFGSFATPGGIPGWDPLWGKCSDKPDVEKQIAKYPDQFAVEFARGIVWGVQPMVHNFVMRDVTNPRVAKDIQFMKDSAQFYHDNKAFLFDGEMLKPAKLTCATKRVAFLKTTSYKRPHESKECVQPALPCVFHSEWRAPDGRKAAILVNWTREEQAYELELEGVKRRGVLPALSWRRLSLDFATCTAR